MEFIYLLTGLVLGFIISWLFLKAKNNPAGINLENVKMEERLSYLSKINTDLETSKIKIEEELVAEREKLGAANNRIAKAEETFKNLDEKIRLQKKETEELQKQLTTEFENIASKILEEKSKKFTDQNKTNLDIILNPLKERIKEFEEKVDKTYKTESAERITLKAEIKHLVELNTKVSEDANNLANALKGDNKMQGNWGEMILEKVLERSGLIKGQEYEKEVSTSNDDGTRTRPDFVIYLPDKKHIIVDSKVSLVAYENYVNENNVELKEKWMKEHLSSMRNHIKILSDKNYQASGKFDTPDFVLLFVPIESSFSIAVQTDHELFNYAWERKIVIVSPSTLLATLKTISSVWKQERQTKNALEIAKQSGALYDKFVGFIEDLKRIGKSIDQTKNAYDDSWKKLSGHGSLINRVEKIKELGAKNTKSLDQDLIEKPGELT